MPNAPRVRFNRDTSEFSGLLVIIVVGIVGVSSYFAQDHPYRWVALALLLALFGLDVHTMRSGWRQASASLAHGFLAAKTLIIATLMLLPPYNGIFIILFFVLAVEAPLLLSQRGWISWLLGLVLLSFLLLIVQSGWRSGLLQGMLYGAAFYFFASFALLTRRAQTAREESERLLAELQTAHRRLQAYADQVEELTIGAERHRLAREMHDGLAQTLGYLKMRTGQIARWVEAGQTDAAAGALRELAQTANDAYLDLRSAIDGLRLPAEAQSGVDLADRLRRLVAAFESQSGLVVELAIDSEPRLSAPAEAHLLRLVQESLANIRKHAAADRVLVTLTAADERFMLVIEDDGQGFDPGEDVPETRHGLRSMRERASLLGAELQVVSAPEEGTRVCIEWPAVVQPAPSDS
ncbi:MAG TPA: hypothetical protein DEP84_00230 [Chloroflexi bacterium]|nr:hypothetical protein [Chloroflexota bacterium]